MQITVRNGGSPSELPYALLQEGALTPAHPKNHPPNTQQYNWKYSDYPEKSTEYFLPVSKPEHIFSPRPEVPFFPCFCLPHHQPFDDLLGPRLKSRVDGGHTLRCVAWPGDEMDYSGGCMGASLRWERWDAKGRAVIVDPGASQAVVAAMPVGTGFMCASPL